MNERKIRNISEASVERLQFCTNSILNFAIQNLIQIKNTKEAEHVYDTLISMFQASLLLEKKTFSELLNGKENTREKRDEKKEDKTCSICKENCRDPRFLPCFHFYCFSCIDTWEKYNKTCPICRNPF